jgi:hypothetical protein
MEGEIPNRKGQPVIHEWCAPRFVDKQLVGTLSLTDFLAKTQLGLRNWPNSGLNPNHIPQRDRMPCLLLHAATGMGKTKLLRKFRRTHPPVFDSTVGVQKMQIVAMQMPPEPDEKSFYTQLLSSLDAPVRTSMNVHQMRHIVRDLLGFVGARMLIIDEVHTLLASTYRQQRILLNTLRYMANELRIPLICAGTSDAKIRTYY